MEYSPTPLTKLTPTMMLKLTPNKGYYTISIYKAKCFHFDIDNTTNDSRLYTDENLTVSHEEYFSF